MQSLVGFREWKSLKMGSDRNLRRYGHEVFCVFSSEVGHRADLAFAPQQIVGKCRDIAHVDTSANNNSPFADDSQRLYNQVSGGREDNCGVEHGRRRFRRTPSPAGAERPGEFLTCDVSISRERVNLTSLIDSHLRYQMGSRAKTVHPDPLGIARFDKGAESDKACAKQWCGFRIGVIAGNRDTEFLVGGGKFRVTAVTGIPGKLWVIAKVLQPLLTEFTYAAGSPKPRNADTVSDCKPGT